MAEKDRRWSPYGYAFNDPMRFTDPDGMWPDWGEVKSFASGFASVGQTQNIVEENFTLVKNVATNLIKGDYKGAAMDVANTTGIPAVVNAIVGASKGDAHSLGQVANIIVVAIVAHKAGGVGEKIAVADGEKITSKVGEIPKSPRGKGTVPPGERDPQRLYSKSQKAEMLEKQEDKCAQCGETKTLNEVEGHHLDRHADGGRTTTNRGVAVCKTCHIEIHK